MDGWRVDTRLLDGQRVLKTLCLGWLDTWLEDGLPQSGVLLGGCGGLCRQWQVPGAGDRWQTVLGVLQLLVTRVPIAWAVFLQNAGTLLSAEPFCTIRRCLR